MVWIYGGGFVNGGSSPAVYDGSHFARRGIVFVSMNYRLGRFGFFAHPALTQERPKGPLGNYAFLDQIAALQWVKRNVAGFGGDAGNVTLFGESAGGGSVNALMISPLAKGLFHKAIVESGGGPALLAALRNLPAAAIVNGMNLMSPQPDTYSGPMVDGQIVPSEAEAAFRAGQQAHIPYMIGANSREFGFIPLSPDRTDTLFAAFGDDKEKALSAYDPEGKGDKREIGVQ